MNRRMKNILTVVLIMLMVAAGAFTTRYIQKPESQTDLQTISQSQESQTTLSPDKEVDGETQKTESPKEENQKEESVKVETPKKETPKKDTIKQEITKEETPKKETTKKEIPNSETKKEEAKNETPSSKEDVLSGTLTIKCTTILKNTSKCDPAKLKYLPENGYILKKTKVTFKKGETVFDVIRRVCKSKNIQIEYSWTPVYNSYYIEGVSHLYEFDCGYESGWVYLVDGITPNYGCSEYRLKGGEDIVLAYTCEGQGADVESESR